MLVSEWQLHHWSVYSETTIWMSNQPLSSVVTEGGGQGWSCQGFSVLFQFTSAEEHFAVLSAQLLKYIVWFKSLFSYLSCFQSRLYDWQPEVLCTSAIFPLFSTHRIDSPSYRGFCNAYWWNCTGFLYLFKYLFVCSCLTSAKCYLVVAMQPNFSGCVFWTRMEAVLLMPRYDCMGNSSSTPVRLQFNQSDFHCLTFIKRNLQ